VSPIDKQLMLASGQLISISFAAKKTPYSAEYLSLLARKGRLKAVKLSRDWLTTEDAVNEYVCKQTKKHKNRLKFLEKLSNTEAGFASLKAGLYLGLMALAFLVLTFGILTHSNGPEVVTVLDERVTPNLQESVHSWKGFLSWNKIFVKDSIKLSYKHNQKQLKDLIGVQKKVYVINKNQFAKDIASAGNKLVALADWPKWQLAQVQHQSPKMFTLAPIKQEINKAKTAFQNIESLFAEGQIILANRFIQKVDKFSSWQSEKIYSINSSANKKLAQGQIWADNLAQNFDKVAFSYSRALVLPMNSLAYQLTDLKNEVVVAFGEMVGVSRNESVLRLVKLNKNEQERIQNVSQAKSFENDKIGNVLGESVSLDVTSTSSPFNKVSPSASLNTEEQEEVPADNPEEDSGEEEIDVDPEEQLLIEDEEVVSQE